jgi:hypothetical protein
MTGCPRSRYVPPDDVSGRIHYFDPGERVFDLVGRFEHPYDASMTEIVLTDRQRGDPPVIEQHMRERGYRRRWRDRRWSGTTYRRRPLSLQTL